MKIEKNENMCGGKGFVCIEHILDEAEKKDHCGLFAKVTIAPGDSLGFHMHYGESETYYILSGKGDYDDNGSKRLVGPGERTFTPSGCGHAIASVGNEDLVFIALILKD